MNVLYNRPMKKILIFLVIIIAFSSCVVNADLIERHMNAYGGESNSGGNGLQNPLRYGSLEQLVEAIINFVFNLALVIAPLIIIIGGFYIITSSGNPEKIKVGRNIIFYALLGVLIITIIRNLIVSPNPPFGGGGGAV